MKNEKPMKIELHCNYCTHAEIVLVNEDDYNNWAGNGGLVQNSLDYLTAAQRELMISNTCDTCWKNFFSE